MHSFNILRYEISNDYVFLITSYSNSEEEEETSGYVPSVVKKSKNKVEDDGWGDFEEEAPEISLNVDVVGKLVEIK